MNQKKMLQILQEKWFSKSQELDKMEHQIQRLIEKENFVCQPLNLVHQRKLDRTKARSSLVVPVANNRNELSLIWKMKTKKKILVKEKCVYVLSKIF